MSHRIIRLPAVMAMTGLSRSSIYLKLEHNDFPKQISLGDRAVGFLESDIQKWIEERIRFSRSGSTK